MYDLLRQIFVVLDLNHSTTVGLALLLEVLDGIVLLNGLGWVELVRAFLHVSPMHDTIQAGQKRGVHEGAYKVIAVLLKMLANPTVVGAQKQTLEQNMDAHHAIGFDELDDFFGIGGVGVHAPTVVPVRPQDGELRIELGQLENVRLRLQLAFAEVNLDLTDGLSVFHQLPGQRRLAGPGATVDLDDLKAHSDGPRSSESTCSLATPHRPMRCGGPHCEAC